jgi:cytochrome c
MRFRPGVWISCLILILPIFVLAFESADAAKGKELFSSRCAACHGDSGEGKKEIAKMFDVTMLPLGSKKVQSLDDAALKKIIIEGKGKMKPVKMSDQEAADVVAFVRTLKK